jgi:hypothetical protein
MSFGVFALKSALKHSFLSNLNVTSHIGHVGEGAMTTTQEILRGTYLNFLTIRVFTTPKGAQNLYFPVRGYVGKKGLESLM